MCLVAGAVSFEGRDTLIGALQSVKGFRYFFRDSLLASPAPRCGFRRSEGRASTPRLRTAQAKKSEPRFFARSNASQRRAVTLVVSAAMRDRDETRKRA